MPGVPKRGPARSEASYADIEADPALAGPAGQAGRTLFNDNCAACHGVGGTGGPGYPDLAAKAWLWGGEPETIEETIRVGINSTNDDTRTSQMLAFGRDGILPAEGNAERIEAGKQVFADNCVACHGEDARGNHDVGAPNLTDDSWIYGGDEQSVYTSVFSGRQGHMPHWDSRLSPLQIKLLTLYVHTLPGDGK